VWFKSPSPPGLETEGHGPGERIGGGAEKNVLKKFKQRGGQRAREKDPGSDLDHQETEKGSNSVTTGVIGKEREEQNRGGKFHCGETNKRQRGKERLWHFT